MGPPPEPHRADPGSALRPGTLLALLGLTGFAVSQPLLAMAGENPTLFTFARVDGTGVVVFALVVALGPPLALWGIVVGAGLIDRRAGDITYTVVAAALAAAAAVQLARWLGEPPPALLAAIALMTAAGFATALLRWRWVDLWIRYTALLPAIAVALFLLGSPTGKLLQPPATVEEVEVSDLPPVVFVMLDELPLRSVLGQGDTVDEVRFPNLAALAEDATWYRNYTVMAPQTTRSVPSALTGRNPTDDPPLWRYHPDSLFSLLAPTHDLLVWESVTQLCGFEACVPGGSGDLVGVFRELMEAWQQRVGFWPVDEPDLGQFRETVVAAVADDRPTEGPDQVLARPERLTDFLETLEPGDRPGLHYLHLLLPHQPWSSYPDGTQYRAPELDLDPSDERITGTAGGWELGVLKQQHLLQAQYTDRLIGDVLERMAETGLYDDALVVVTADHGISFQSWPDHRTPDDDEAMGDVAYVPLLVKAPGQTTGRVDDSNLMAVDLLPTLAELVGLDVGWDLDGHRAGSPRVEARDGKVMFDFGHGFSGSFQGVNPLAAQRPRVTDRLIGPLPDGESPLAGLTDLLGVSTLLDTPFDELGVGAEPVGSATLAGLADLSAPPDREPRPGFVEGTAEGATGPATVLVAVNGTVVSAAPLGASGEFQALLPPGALEPSGNELRLALTSGDDVVGELRVG